MKTLRWNNSGVHVIRLRGLLVIRGYDADTSDELLDVFDWHLYVRVLQFQVAMVKNRYDWRISDVDGICGPKTWSALGTQEEETDETPDEVQPEPSKALVDVIRESPNQSERGATVTSIVLHNTAGSYASSVDWLCNPAAKASAHLVISRGGHATQLVSFAKKAWHAGNGRVNANSIGIEIEATNSQKCMTLVQEAKVIAWVKHLMASYNVPIDNVLIHRWVSNTDCPSLIWKTDDIFKAWKKRNFG